MLREESKEILRNKRQKIEGRKQRETFEGRKRRDTFEGRKLLEKCFHPIPSHDIKALPSIR